MINLLICLVTIFAFDQDDKVSEILFKAVKFITHERISIGLSSDDKISIISYSGHFRQDAKKLDNRVLFQNKDIDYCVVLNKRKRLHSQILDFIIIDRVICKHNYKGKIFIQFAD